MTRWHVIHGDILDVNADGLVCSANPQLNLSGGVGGAFLLRYGDEMQAFLHDYLREHDLRYVDPGNAVIGPSCGSPFKAVAHAVAIDAFYDTNAERILAAYRSAINGLRDCGCRSLAAACLGCGYGRCPTSQFAKSIEWLIAVPFGEIENISFVTTNEELVSTLATVIGNANR